MYIVFMCDSFESSFIYNALKSSTVGINRYKVREGVHYNIVKSLKIFNLFTVVRYDCVMEGTLYKRCSDSSKWLQRWFKLYQVSILIPVNLHLNN